MPDQADQNGLLPIQATAASQSPAKPSRPFNERHLRKFLSFIVDPAHTTEVCVLSGQYARDGSGIVPTDYASTLSGWFGNVDAVVANARQLRGASAYACLNPANRLLRGRSDNRMTRVKNRTKDEEIVCLRWLYIDVDSVGPDGASATQEHLDWAVAKRDAILKDHPEIRRVSLTGRSGNGAFIMARLPDYPNDPEHERLVGSALDSLGAKYTDATAKVDVKVKNPARLGCLPGTWKCKGSNIPEQPWRLATLEGVPEGPDLGPDGTAGGPPTLDLRAWLAANPAPVAVTPVRPVAHAGPRATGGYDDRGHRANRAASYLDRVPGSICGNQECHDKAFNAACILVKGFDLSEHEARPMLLSWMAKNPAHQWRDQEVAHKLRSADQLPDDKPRGYLYEADRPGWQADYGTGTAAHRERYAGPGADFIIGQIAEATGGDGLAAHVGNGHAVNDHAINGHSPAPHHVPVLLLEPIKARAAHHVANARIEDLYRDTDFLSQLARLEKENRGEAEAIKVGFEGIRGYKARAFKAALDGVRRGPGRGNFIPDAGDCGDDSGYSPSDMGNAQRFLEAHGHEARWCKAYGDWMVFDGTRWKQDEGLQADLWSQEIPGLIGASITPDMDDDEVKAITDWKLKSESKLNLANLLVVARASLPVIPEQFDQDPWMFNCQNGTIDLRAMEFQPHKPGDLLTKVAPVIFDKDAKCPRWDRFILEIMNGDPELAAYIRRVFGYAMTGVVKDHAFFICYGGGGNGKGLLLNTLSHIVGDYAIDLDPDVILAQANAQHPTGLTDFEGRRLVISEETDDKRGLAEALVKRLSGGDKIRARKMRGDFYTFKPTHHLILATNHKPNIRNNDYGLWRRLKLIPFNVTFGVKDGKKPDKDVRKPDRDLMDKLAAEAPGILNWLLAGCKDWQDVGLNEPKSILDATQEYRTEMDELGWFLEEKTDDVRDDPRARVIFNVIYGEYKAWADFNNIKPVGPKKFGAQLNDRGFTTWKVGSETFKRGLRLKINGKSVEKGPADEGDDSGEFAAAHEGNGHGTAGSTEAYRDARRDVGGREPGDDGDWLIER